MRLLIETIEVSRTIGDEDFTLRLEIFENLEQRGTYSARLWRLESYRIQATFPQVHGGPAHAPSDEQILKEFEGLSLSDGSKAFESAQAARNEYLREIAAWFGGLAETRNARNS